MATDQSLWVYFLDASGVVKAVMLLLLAVDLQESQPVTTFLDSNPRSEWSCLKPGRWQMVRVAERLA